MSDIRSRTMSDLVERLRVKALPQIGGYNGDYTDEEYVLETFAEAADEIERLREALAKIASQSPSTPSKMLIEYASAVFSQSVVWMNNERV